jgi:hypothetical protein
MTRSWKRDFESKSGDVKSIFGKNDIVFNVGDHVIIPTLDKIDGRYTMPGVIVNIHHKSPAQMNVPGATRLDSIPLADIRWSKQGIDLPDWLEDVGLAFLVHIGGPKMSNPVSAASRAMFYHNKGREEQAERASRAADREAKRQEREERSKPAPPPPDAPSTAPSAAIRRVGGVPAPPPEKKPQKMSDDQVRQMLGLRRR